VKPGLRAGDGYLEIVAGWRMPEGKGFRVGTLTAKLALRFDRGRLQGKLYDLSLAPELDLLEAVGNAIVNKVGEMEDQITAGVNARFDEIAGKLAELLAALAKAKDPVPLLTEPLTRIRIEVKPGRFVLTINPPRPPADAKGPWAIRFIPLRDGADRLNILINGEFWNPTGEPAETTTWKRAEGDQTIPLPEKWQGSTELRVVAVSGNWGKQFLMVVLHNGSPAALIFESKIGDRLVQKTERLDPRNPNDPRNRIFEFRPELKPLVFPPPPKK
jgi:hypothetical protein